MNIYLLTQDEETGYDTYDSCVVAAESEEEARKIHPGCYVENFNEDRYCECNSWAHYPEQVTILLVSQNTESYIKKGVICSSFNAG
jgi:ferredoxin-thioredoxin reductase catalytic subunit